MVAGSKEDEEEIELTEPPSAPSFVDTPCDTSFKAGETLKLQKEVKGGSI